MLGSETWASCRGQAERIADMQYCDRIAHIKMQSCDLVVVVVIVFVRQSQCHLQFSSPCNSTVVARTNHDEDARL